MKVNSVPHGGSNEDKDPCGWAYENVEIYIVGSQDDAAAEEATELEAVEELAADDEDDDIDEDDENGGKRKIIKRIIVIITAMTTNKIPASWALVKFVPFTGPDLSNGCFSSFCSSSSSSNSDSPSIEVSLIFFSFVHGMSIY